MKNKWVLGKLLFSNHALQSKIALSMATVANGHKLGSAVSHSSAGKKADIKVLAGPFSQKLVGRILSPVFLACVTASNPRCPLACTFLMPASVCRPCQVTWPPLSVSPRGLQIKTPVLGFRAHMNPAFPNCTRLHLQRPYFQLRSHFEVPGGHEFWTV